MSSRSVLSALLAAAVAVLSLSSAAIAWSPSGHMTLGAITYRELERIDPAALEAVLELLRQHPHHGDLIDGPEDRELDAEARRMGMFMRATRWADDVRNPPYDEYSHPAWHYVNFRYRPPDELIPPRGPAEDGYLLWALEENVRRLESDSATVRAVALTWLFHLVTDIHQPLHNIALVSDAFPDGDRGGNLFRVYPNLWSEPISLHWYWDGLISDSEEVEVVLERARQLGRDTGVDEGTLEAALAVEGFRAWSEEGARVAMAEVYRHGRLPTGTEADPVLVPFGYRRNSEAVAHHRGVLGALRLARLLAERF